MQQLNGFHTQPIILDIFVLRTLVLPYDLGRFDAMVSAHEKDALEYLSTYVPGNKFIWSDDRCCFH